MKGKTGSLEGDEILLYMLFTFLLLFIVIGISLGVTR